MELQPADSNQPCKPKKPKAVVPRETLPVVPEELEMIWDDEVARLFRTLPPNRQKFLVAYIREQHGTKAYREAYNPLASDNVGRACAGQILANPTVRAILERFTDRSLEALFVVPKTLFEAATTAMKPVFGKDEEGQPCHIEDLPDHDVRIKGALGLAKLYGLNAPEKVDVKPSQAMPVEFTNQFNFYLQQIGQKPVALPTVEEAEVVEKPAGFPRAFKDYVALTKR